MENIKILKAEMDKDMERETRRTFYGIFLLLLIYGSLVLGYLIWIAENDKTITK